ncbi:MAG: hypothetical protein ACOX2O_01900 [Bdellovibrionota bacterium]|jgi:hypothetical protein
MSNPAKDSALKLDPVADLNNLRSSFFVALESLQDPHLEDAHFSVTPQARSQDLNLSVRPAAHLEGLRFPEPTLIYDKEFYQLGEVAKEVSISVAGETCVAFEKPMRGGAGRFTVYALNGHDSGLNPKVKNSSRALSA